MTKEIAPLVIIPNQDQMFKKVPNLQKIET